MKKYIVYKITHKPTGMFYIGRKTSTETEFESYWGSSTHPLFWSNKNKKFKGGYCIEENIDDYQKEIVELCNTTKQLSVAEEYWIEKHFNDELNANKYYNGKFCNTQKHSEEYMKMMKEINSGENNPFYGRKHSEETKKKMRKPKSTTENMKGIIKTKEHRSKLSEANKRYAEEMKAKGECTSKRLNVKVKCPYDDYINTAGNVSKYIKKHFPDRKQWQDYTKEEKNSFKIK